MTFWICLALWCLISSISIYYSPESDIRAKSYDHLNFSRASIVQFRASRYIIGMNQTSKSKVMTFWICLALWCWILSISIYYVPKSDIRVTSYVHKGLSSAFVLQFWASQYIIGLNRTSESKVCWTLWPCGLSYLRGIGLECRRSNNNQFNNIL